MLTTSPAGDLTHLVTASTLINQMNIQAITHQACSDQGDPGVAKISTANELTRNGQNPDEKISEPRSTPPCVVSSFVSDRVIAENKISICL
jgi:hypothetical protein